MERSYVNYYSVRSLHNDAIEMRLNFCSLIVNYIIFFHDTRPLPSSFAKTWRAFLFWTRVWIMLLHFPSKYCLDTKFWGSDVEATCQNEFKKLVFLYVTYPCCTLGTSWCSLLKKKKVLLPSTRGLHRRRLLYPCWPVWANILLTWKKNVGVSRNCTELNSVNVAGKLEYHFLRWSRLLPSYTKFSLLNLESLGMFCFPSARL